jgi:hypothetical protein
VGIGDEEEGRVFLITIFTSARDLWQEALIKLIDAPTM